MGYGDVKDLSRYTVLLKDSSHESFIRAAGHIPVARDNGKGPALHDGDDDGTLCLSRSRLYDLDIGCARVSDTIVDRDIEPFQCADTPKNESGKPVDALVPSFKRPVIEQIESIFEGMADALLNERHRMSVTLQTRLRRGVSDNARQSRSKRLYFPGSSAKEAWRFTVIIRILSIIHEALRSNVVLSKRDIYYRDPALFGNQEHVDRHVDDIALTLGVIRSMLNITAAIKGLVAGAVEFCRRDGVMISAASDRDGLLVPSLREILSVDMKHVKWILVVEKEATFRSLNASSFWEIICSQGIIITGKGYPDLATRALLRFLSSPTIQNGFASPPVFGLADFDPDGVTILSVYKHGSAALAHESHAHSVHGLKWLGLRSEHMMSAMVDAHATQGLFALTIRDRKRAVKLLEQEIFDGNNGRPASRVELQTMLMLNVKAELQLLDALEGGLANVVMCEFRQICNDRV